DGQWVAAQRASLLPGRILCVASRCGGYRTDRGFDPESKENVPEVPQRPIADTIEALELADDQQDGETLSARGWKTIACHTAEVEQEVNQISRQLGLPPLLHDALG